MISIQWHNRKTNTNSTDYFLTLCAVVVLIMYVSIKTTLMIISVPVVVGMQGELTKRSSDSVVLEVTGYKIRDCELNPKGFQTEYSPNDGKGSREGGKLTFPFDRKAGNSRPKGLINKYNFGLFKLHDIPESAVSVTISSEHYCNVDGAIVKVTSLSQPWNVTGVPNEKIYDEYASKFKNYDAFTVPKK